MIFFIASPVHQAQQRELTMRHVKETEKELSRNFQLQKEQYEATIQRHLTFIDQVGILNVHSLSFSYMLSPSSLVV